MTKDYETSQATDYQSFVREQGFNKDLTVPKLKPKGVGSAMSRPHQADDLDYAINPKGAEAQERYLQQSERARLQEAADHGSPLAIAKLAAPRCKICNRFNPYEDYSQLNLNSLIYGHVREYFSALMPELNEDHAREGNSKLVYHICWAHEEETKKATEVMVRCQDARSRVIYLQEMMRRQRAAEERYKDFAEASRLNGEIVGIMKLLKSEVSNDTEVKEVLQRSVDNNKNSNDTRDRDKAILYLCDPDVRIKETYYPPNEGGGAN